MDVSVNIQLYHIDVPVYTLEDLLIALSPSRSSNMDVRKWISRLNSDKKERDIKRTRDKKLHIMNENNNNDVRRAIVAARTEKAGKAVLKING